jgi:hypothetical protein
MWSGYLHCTKCRYRTDDFLVMPHWGWTHGVLFQDTDSMALRVFQIPDDDAPDLAQFPTEDDETRAFVAFTARAIARERRTNERHVELNEFFCGDGATSLPCPQCRQLLNWVTTGIS